MKAEIAYVDARNELSRQLDRLKDGVHAIEREQCRSPRSWGHAGTVKHVAAKLAELADMLLCEGEHAE